MGALCNSKKIVNEASQTVPIRETQSPSTAQTTSCSPFHPPRSFHASRLHLLSQLDREYFLVLKPHEDDDVVELGSPV